MILGMTEDEIDFLDEWASAQGIRDRKYIVWNDNYLNAVQNHILLNKRDWYEAGGTFPINIELERAFPRRMKCQN